jgi:hypothetical protein
LRIPAAQNTARTLREKTAAGNDARGAGGGRHFVNQSSARFLNEHSDVRDAYRGQDLLQTAIFYYAVGIKQCAIGNFAVIVAPDGEPRVDRVTVKKFRRDFSYNIIGEDQYTVTHVLSGSGRQNIDEDALSVLKRAPLIKNLSTDDAWTLSTAVIRATAITAESIPIPSGHRIGGPIHAYLVNGGRSPTKLPSA